MEKIRLREGVVGFDELQPGHWFETSTIKVTAEMIDRFADLTGDHFEIHMDEDAARKKGFGGRVAHGLLVLSLVDTLKNHARSKLQGFASLAWNWSFDAPVLAGDTIYTKVEILGKRKTKKQDRGIVELGFVVKNQDGMIVQSGSNKLMVHR